MALPPLLPVAAVVVAAPLAAVALHRPHFLFYLETVTQKDVSDTCTQDMHMQSETAFFPFRRPEIKSEREDRVSEEDVYQ